MANRRGPWGARRSRFIEPLVVCSLLAVVAIAGIIAIARSGSLGYDEAIYASKARSIVTDIPASAWAIYRPPGLPWLGIIASPVGFSDENLRGITLVLGLVSLIAVWALARQTSGRAAGVVALVAVLGCPVVLTEIRTFHNDLPAVGLLLLLMLLLWDQFEVRAEPNALLIAAGPIAAAAFYLRFGSVAAIGAVAIAALLLWGGQMRRHARIVVGTVAIACALAVPHAVAAIVATGSPFGILRVAADLVDTTPPLVTLGQYVRWLPLQLAGAGLVIIAVGLIDAVGVAITSIRERTLTADARRDLWLLLPAAITATGLVLVSHPERRYILFPLLLALIAGAGPTIAWLRWLVANATRRRALDVPNLGLGALVAGLVVVGTLAALRQVAIIDNSARQTQWRAVAGQAIAADAGGPCTVVTTLPPIGWYSGCETVSFGADPIDVRDQELPAPAYVVFATADRGRVRPGLIDKYRVLIEPQPILAISGDSGHTDAEVYRIRR